ncbi:hypothetical protein ABEW34_17125 [Paenibacillus algorifonticola]|uniref:hypothetical protein n=1 Tax=Paenibacillus algorifonticola TaxID=684063 RepID=UPI003D27723A
MWFDKDSNIQQLPLDLEKLFNNNGWNTFIKYRSVYKNTKFADVRLFRSRGSDGQVRNFGMVYGYGTKNTATLGEADFISQNSILGQLVRIPETDRGFQFKVYPIVKDTVIIYRNGVEVPKADYTLDDFKGQVLMGEAPVEGDKYTVSYEPAQIAPRPPKRMYFFTFDDVRGEKIVQAMSDAVYIGDPESILPDGDGSRKSFPIPTTATLKAGTVTFYKNKVEVSPDLYTVNYASNTITLTGAAPESGAEMNVSYIKVLNGNGTDTLDYGDIPVKSFDPDKGDQLLNAAYTAIYYLYPSLPTAMSFTPLDDFSRGWQRDSTIYYWGNITKDRIVMFLRPDPTPGPENTYYAPLYIGRLTTLGKAPRKNHVIMSGCRAADEVKWKANMKLGALFVDYGNNTSNGNSSVQLQQSIGGTYYQHHYLAFISHDKQVDEGEARFNPSVYSGKYHISPMYIVHPNDGFVGKLDECYAVHPKNISQLDELEVVETAENEDLGKGDGTRAVFHLSHRPSLKNDGTPFNIKIKVDCVEMEYGTDYTIEMETKAITFAAGYIPGDGEEVIATYDYKQLYRYTLADTPVSPLTLANMSPFAPIGLGILKETLIKNQG